jgi:hypothetical protein
VRLVEEMVLVRLFCQAYWKSQKQILFSGGLINIVSFKLGLHRRDACATIAWEVF